MDAQNIGRFLIKLRKENNLTQKDISKLCNVSTQAVSKWERGESVPDVELLERLSILYKVSINELINGEKQEVYIDVEKRKNIMSLTASALVFIAYFFTFVKAEAELGDLNPFDINITMKGYELIFNGVGGIVVYLSWLVFIVLISFLVLNIFIVTKIVNLDSKLNAYIKTAGIIIILISLVGIIVGMFLPFPQFIIMLCTSIILYLHKDNDGTNDIFLELKEYRKQRKQKNINQELLLDLSEANKKKLKIAKVLTVFIIVIYTIFVMMLIIQVIVSFTNDYYDQDYMRIFLGVVWFSVSLLVLLKSLMYFGSIFTSFVLRINAFLTSVYPFILLTMLPRMIPIEDGVTGNFLIYISVLFGLSLIPVLFIYYSNTIKKVY